ncbi:uncharacterized protein BDV17DRAFT_267950 [Aspergillus undulatus]|uniref:uncharacterized protein n=1 Tax=Aspergillus undulatus TaxID=1810928 RepID=UPI003CCDD469
MKLLSIIPLALLCVSTRAQYLPDCYGIGSVAGYYRNGDIVPICFCPRGTDPVYGYTINDVRWGVVCARSQNYA